MPAKFSLLTVIAVPLLPILPLLACGGDDGGSIHVPDAKPVDSPPPVVCSAMASYGTISSFSASGAKYTAGSAADATNELLWQGKLADSNALEVLIFGGCGSGSGSQCGGSPTPDWPTTFGPKASLDLSAPPPDALVLLLAKLNTSTNRFDDIYLGTAGTLNVTAAGSAGSTFSGSVSNLTAEHVIISQTSIDPAPDGCQSMVTGFAFSGSAAFTGKTTIIEGPTREEALRSYLSHRFQ